MVKRLTKAQIDELIGTGSTEGLTDGLYWTRQDNLYLQVRGDSVTWVFRYNQGKRNRHMGLGSTKKVTYAAAQAEVIKWLAVLRSGGDPIAIRRAERDGHALPASSSSSAPSFKAMARDYIANHEERWRDPRASIDWSRRLREHVHPVIGQVPVDQVTVDHVVQILEPIWHSMPPTASKVRAHVAQILDWASAHGHRQESNPARMEGALPIRLGGKPRHVVNHYRAVPVADAPAFWKALAELSGAPAAAMRFQVLTVVRPSEARGARWEEIDLGKRTWAIPAERMKGGRHPHRVPLSAEALVQLKKAEPRDSGLIFPSTANGETTSGAWTKVIRRTGFDATAHGIRSTFSDWCREIAVVDRELRELSLAHREKSEVVAAYARSDLLHQRGPVMESWARFLSGMEDGDD